MASELEELERAGIRFEVDEAAKAKGWLQLRVYPVVGGEEVVLVAQFPDLYPWFRFEVSAPFLDLPRHQHPFAKTLCLIPRETYWWRPQSDRLAHFLRDRLELVLQAGGAPAPVPQIDEEVQAEPFTDFYLYHRDAMLLVDGQWRFTGDARSGSLSIGVENLPPGARRDALLRGAVAELRDDAGNVLYSGPPRLIERFPGRVMGRWTRHDTPPEGTDAEIFNMLATADARPRATSEVRVMHGTLAIRLALFPEEHRWRGSEGDVFGQGWLGVCRYTRDVVKERRSAGRGRRDQIVERRPPLIHYLVRAGRSGQGEALQRAPELLPLMDRSMAMIGLGCIGAPSVLELARAGIGDLRVMDHDFVDPATSVRWPRGITAAGLLKASVMDQIIAADYPFTRVRSFTRRLGTVNEGSPESDWALVKEWLDDADLLYDASAEDAVQQFLAEQARKREIPYVAVFGTQGGWGGTIVRIRPHATEGCWMCYVFALADGTIVGPPELEGDAGRVQPAGCGDPTFIGAGFDLAELALGGTRTAVSTLCEGRHGYPEMAWDVAVLSLRDREGRLITPTWANYALKRHPQCAACNPT